MDLRIEKTEKAIKNAFIELRAKKTLEKITVKELCSCARINKSTFYAHYEDMYALSEALENETVASILNGVSHAYSSQNLRQFTRELFLSFVSHSSLIQILFSGKEQNCLADKIETEIKKTVYKNNPEYKNSLEKNILLSYCIQGSYHAYKNNPDADTEIVIRIIENIVNALQPLY